MVVLKFLARQEEQKSLTTTRWTAVSSLPRHPLWQGIP
jgi:hypothetical protein